MALKAIISDVHANLEALEVVLREIGNQGVDEIWCLGDIVGYGPDPVACVDLVMRNCSLTLMGNHDWALLNTPVGFNTLATAMIYKTKEWMRVTDASTERDIERWHYMLSLPRRAERGNALLVHGSPRGELTDYIFPSDVEYAREKLEDIFGMFDHLCLVGHSHVPCVIDEELNVAAVGGDTEPIDLSEGKHIVNAGSVGQPRDGDNRASFVLLGDDTVRFRRVPYDFRRTLGKLSRLGEDYKMLGYRLGLGR